MNSVIYIKANKEVKENAAKIAHELGLSLSDVINASLRNFIRTREIVFSHTPQMTPELESLLASVEPDLKSGSNLSLVFDSAQSAVNYLDSLDHKA